MVAGSEPWLGFQGIFFLEDWLLVDVVVVVEAVEWLELENGVVVVVDSVVGLVKVAMQGLSSVLINGFLMVVLLN